MTAVRSFLDWFDGVSAFMGNKPPKPGEWTAIKARIDQLRIEAAAEPEPVPYCIPLPGHSSGPAPVAKIVDGWRGNKPVWNAEFVAALIESGCDGQTAKEGLNEKGLDYDRDPKQVAKETLKDWGMAA